MISGILGLAYFVGGGGRQSDYIKGVSFLAVCLIVCAIVVFSFQKNNKHIYLKSKELSNDEDARNSCDRHFGY